MKTAKILTFSSLLCAAGLLYGCGSSDETQVEPPEVEAVEPPEVVDPLAVEVTENKLGAWIFYIDEPGLVRGNHADMATYLADMGVKRVFIKISDINYQWENNKITFDGDKVDCGVWQDACEPSNLQYYRDAGIEPWAWTYNDIHNFEDQAMMVTAAAKVGYQGFIMDIEVEFDGLRTELTDIMVMHRQAVDDAVNEGIIDDSFKLGVTTWGNPGDHQMAVDIIDAYADMHMPQTYIEKWGGSYLTDIAGAIEQGDCEYRNLGAVKPIWHIVSHEDAILSADDLNQFVAHAGPNTSVWRIDDEAVSESLKSVDWAKLSYTKNECTQNNMELEND